MVYSVLGYGFNGFDLGPYEGGQFEHFHHNEHEPHYYLDHGHHHKLHDHHVSINYYQIDTTGLFNN